MSSTLSEGVRVPDIGSVNWGADVNFNWGLLNTALANISGNVKVDAENTWTAPQTFTETISGSIDGVAARAVGDEDGNNIKTALAGKQPSLSQSQLAAVNSGITASAVQQIGTNASNISALQTAVASKAADADVVHLAGAETITGDKTWTGLNTYQRRLNLKDATAISAGGFGVGLNFYDYEGNRYGYILPHVTSGGTKNIVFTNTASGYLEFASPMVTQNVIPETGATYNLGDPTKWYKDTYTNTVWVQGVRAPGTSNALILAAMETWEDGARIFMYGKDNANGSTIYADVDHNDGNHDKTGVTLNKYGFYPAGISRHLGLADANNRWLTFNGINPGALGMPDYSKVVSIDTTNWSVPGDNVYTPILDGWLYVITKDTATSSIFIYASSLYGDPQYSGSVYGNGTQGTGRLSIMFPVRANVQYTVILRGDSASDIYAVRYYPCLGNV